MKQVSCRATRLLLETLDARGIDGEAIALRLGIPVALLRDTRGRIAWNQFAALNDEIARIVGGNAAMEELGVDAIHTDSYRLFRRAAPHVLSTSQLHQLGERLFARALFPELKLKIVSSSDRCVVAEGSIPLSLRGCASFFHVCRGTMIGMSTLRGLPRSVVTGTITSHSARFEILLPPERGGLLATIRRGCALLRGRTFLDELVGAQSELNDTYGALQRNRQEFRSLLERAPMMIAIQRGGRYVWVNPAFTETLGWDSPEQLVGRSLFEDAHPDDRAVIAARIAMPAGDTAPGEYRVLRRDGSTAVCEIAATQEIEFEGAPARLLVATDITERRRVREQLALADRMASVGMLAAGVAHEINNPLTYVQLNLELLARGLAKQNADSSLRSPLLNLAAEAMDGVERVRSIVADLRTLARTDEETIGAVDAREVIASTIRLASKTADRSATVEPELGDVPHVRGNRARLGQVLLNLLLNAHQAIEERGDDGVIRVRTFRSGDDRVTIEIADSGAGIRPADLARVFDPFFTTKPVGRGTGLGLAICHQIVTRFGGEIVVESDPSAAGDRTLRTFVRVTLPTAAAPAREERVAEKRERAPRRILIVDDDPSVARALHLVLAERHQVVVLSDGRTALERLREDRSFDLVLCDVMMPDYDGIALFEEVRRLDPSFAGRFVFMTGGAFTPRARAFLATCVNHTIEKPFDFGQIAALVDGVDGSGATSIPLTAAGSVVDPP